MPPGRAGVAVQSGQGSAEGLRCPSETVGRHAESTTNSLLICKSQSQRQDGLFCNRTVSLLFCNYWEFGPCPEEPRGFYLSGPG